MFNYPLKASLISTVFTSLLFLSSCQSIHYVATYDIKSRKDVLEKATGLRLIDELAKEHDLRPETESGRSDTLRLYGKPYHQFRIVMKQNSTQNGIIELEYWGGPTSRNAYRKFLNEMTDFVQTNYHLLNTHIVETK